MVPERKCDETFVQDREIYCESNVWCRALSYEKIWEFDADVWVWMKQWISWYGLVLRRALDFVVEGQRKKGGGKEGVDEAG